MIFTREIQLSFCLNILYQHLMIGEAKQFIMTVLFRVSPNIFYDIEV